MEYLCNSRTKKNNYSTLGHLRTRQSQQISNKTPTRRTGQDKWQADRTGGLERRTRQDKRTGGQDKAWDMAEKAKCLICTTKTAYVPLKKEFWNPIDFSPRQFWIIEKNLSCYCPFKGGRYRVLNCSLQVHISCIVHLLDSYNRGKHLWVNSLAGESRELLKVAVTRRLLHGTARAVICEQNTIIKETAEKEKKQRRASKLFV
jgi:hypothetical protein